MKKIPQNLAVLIIAIVIAMVTIAVLIGFTSTNTALDHREKIYPIKRDSAIPMATPLKISDMEPNSMFYFMYPPGLSSLGNDNHFQKFMIIRLPALMGGAANDISSFRAYSAVDLASHCLIKYWPNEGRQRIEDPCTSPSYRAIDGISEYWPNSNVIRAPSTGALPMLELSSDEEGYIYVEPPTFTAQKNGVIGYGRDVTQAEFEQGTNLIKKFEDQKEEILSSFYLPGEIADGYFLAEVSDMGDTRVARYVVPGRSADMVYMSFSFCNCTKDYKEVLATEGKTYFAEFWSVGDTDIYASPGHVDTKTHKHSLYSFKFYHEGFRVELVTSHTFEEGMQMILSSYYPEYSLSDLERIET